MPKWRRLYANCQTVWAWWQLIDNCLILEQSDLISKKFDFCQTSAKMAALAEPIVWQLYLKDFLSQMKNLIWKLPCSPQQCDEDDDLEIATTDFKPSHPLDGGQRCRSPNRAMCTNFKECQHKYTEVHIAGIHNAWCSRKKSTKLTWAHPTALTAQIWTDVLADIIAWEIHSGIPSKNEQFRNRCFDTYDKKCN